jgi:hypothetical protein
MPPICSPFDAATVTLHRKLLPDFEHDPETFHVAVGEAD